MKKMGILLCFLLALAVVVAPTIGGAQEITLFESALNNDGSISYAPLGADTLGGFTQSITGVGAHFLIAFFDYEIDQGINTYFNEYGEPVNTPYVEQSWEIDEPGWVFGDIYDNFLAGTLDNTNAVPVGSEDDVSFAIGWDFILLDGETANISFLLSETAPVSDFYLAQVDPDSDDATIYFSSSFRKNGGGGGNGNVIPEPSTMLLMGVGLMGVCAAGRKRLL